MFNLKDKIGATITSVMVAIVLSGLVGMGSIKLIGNQTLGLLTIELQEQRETLLKHYTNLTIEGWDETRRRQSSFSGSIDVYNRNGTKIINKTNGIKLGKDLKRDSSGWWTVTATAKTTESTDIEAGKHTNAPDIKEKTVRITIKVDFDPSKHPNVSYDIADREAAVYLHDASITPSTPSNTICSGTKHPSQQDSRTDPDSPIYPSGQGAIVQYDFKSNYTRCSHVPLIASQTCSDVKPITGFNGSGVPLCATDSVTITPGCNSSSGSFITTISNTGMVSCNQQTGNTARVPIDTNTSCNISFTVRDTTQSREQRYRGAQTFYPSGLRGFGSDGSSAGCSTFSPPLREWMGVTGPIGDNGDRGDRGQRGARGDRGITGRDGLKGFQGPQGSPGSPGVPGDRGPQGFAGPKGPDGSKGSSGSCYTKERDCSLPGADQSCRDLGYRECSSCRCRSW